MGIFALGGMFLVLTGIHSLYSHSVLTRVVAVEQELAKIVLKQMEFVPEIQQMKSGQAVANAQVEQLVLVREEHGKIFELHERQRQGLAQIQESLARLEQAVIE